MKSPALQKSYPGERPRPSAHIDLMATEDLLLITTPWGNQNAKDQLHNTVKEFLSAALGDHEVTSPFSRLPSLSSAENNIRSALLLANDIIFQKCNKEAYTSSVEFLALHFHKSEVVFAQVGQPNLLLLRENRLFPIQVALDLSLDFRNPTPIPSRLVGLERTWEVEVKSMNLTQEDSLILLSRSLIPPSFFSTDLKGMAPEAIVNQFYDLAVDDDPKAPFWITLLTE